MRNSFEMEARGRSEACRIRLGQAIASGLSLPPPHASPPPPPSTGTFTVILSCVLKRVVAGTNLKVEAGPPTDSNEQWQLVLLDRDL